ncbi:MAG: hydantoinase B/oxoprolinase family protein [Candidimonas sp.]|nr:MAG: hydantoinase B/oxoprolinase family protein [Candidimonas sp.]TAM26768.1 MAG: hydantoinase B/oxoprolinase family protein [Candidimonas sp.]TAM74443.1 MAG: hydantoinase B/oxoprolinase family protein [Candidimonas sp.]
MNMIAKPEVTPARAPAILDPITVEVVRNKLEGIANEMEMTLLKSSFSPIVKEGLDASASLFTPDGTTLAQACAIPIHLATLIPAVAAIIEAYPVKTMQENDSYIINDPYCGGTHLPDIAVVAPVFHRGRVIALSGAMTHHGDVGGMSAGSVPTNATEIYQEGIRIPPLKLRIAGVYNETLVKMLRQNVRTPDAFMGDLNAEIAACNVGARRVSELADVYGADHLERIFDDLLTRSETMTRKALRAIPSGSYHYVDYLDNDGIELDKQIRIEVTVTVQDGNIGFDFEGTSPQVKGPMNCVRSGTLAAACYAVRALTDPTIPNNGGCFRPISLHLPQGSLVNPVEPAPVNARTATIKRIAGCIIGALAPAMLGTVPAASAGELLVLAFGGRKSTGEKFIIGETIAGGSGACKDRDGVDVIETDATNCMNIPAEAIEMESPIRVRRVALRSGSGGAGLFRGGLGVVREYEVLDGEISLSHRGERHFSAPLGIDGGANGAMARSVIHRADGTQQVIPSKIVTVLHKGDRLVIETAGGGGFGDPSARDPQRIQDDIKNGKISQVAVSGPH